MANHRVQEQLELSQVLTEELRESGCAVTAEDLLDCMATVGFKLKRLAVPQDFDREGVSCTSRAFYALKGEA